MLKISWADRIINQRVPTENDRKREIVINNKKSSNARIHGNMGYIIIGI